MLARMRMKAARNKKIVDECQRNNGTHELCRLQKGIHRSCRGTFAGTDTGDGDITKLSPVVLLRRKD